MAILKVQEKHGQSGASTVSVNLDSTPVIGNMLVAFVRGNTSTPTDITITSETWDDLGATGPSAPSIRAFKRVADGSEDIITADAGSGASMNIIVLEYSGVASTEGTNGSVGSGTSLLSGNSVTTNNQCLILAGFAFGGSTQNHTWTNSFTTEMVDPDFITLIVGKRSVTSSGTYNTTCSWNTSRSARSRIVALVAAATAPTVTTQAATEITATSATGNGNVTDDGGSTITERGFVWSTSANPTTTDNKTTVAGTTGAYSGSMTGLTTGTLYHYRAYAINAIGTSYGADTTFTPSEVKTINGLDRSSVKTVNGLPSGSVKTWNGRAF